MLLLSSDQTLLVHRAPAHSKSNRDSGSELGGSESRGEKNVVFSLGQPKEQKRKTPASAFPWAVI